MNVCRRTYIFWGERFCFCWLARKQVAIRVQFIYKQMYICADVYMYVLSFMYIHNTHTQARVGTHAFTHV